MPFAHANLNADPNLPSRATLESLPVHPAGVLDPIFSHLAEPTKWLVRGKFWKDYVVSSW